MSNPSTLTLTEEAAQKIYELVTHNPDNGEITQYLRISLEGGGCSGFKYVFALDDSIQNDDVVAEKIITPPNQTNPVAVKVLINMFCYTYLQNASIDYREIQGEFVISNPNAKTTCGCGSSFSVE